MFERMPVKSSIIFVFLAIAWLSAGRRFTLALDRVVNVRAKSLPVSPLQYDGGGFVIGDLAMTFGSAHNLRYDLSLNSDPANRVVLSAGNHCCS